MQFYDRPLEQRCKVAEHNMETLQKRNITMQENKWNFSWMKKRHQFWMDMNQWKIELRVMGTTHQHKEKRSGHWHDWAREETLGKTRSQTKEMSSPRNESMERADLTMEDWIQETFLISPVTSGPTEPKTFQEAWHYPTEEERNNWRTAIWKEIRSVIERGVWSRCKIHSIGIQSNSRS